MSLPIAREANVTSDLSDTSPCLRSRIGYLTPKPNR